MENEEGIDSGAPSKSLPMKQKAPQYFAALVVTTSCLCAGSALGWTSPLLSRLQGISGSYEPMDRPLTPEEASWISSILGLGAIPGTILCMVLMDRFGRKMTIIALGGAPAVVGWIITLVATGPGALYAARILVGIATGTAMTLSPVFLAEISSPSERGALCSCPQLMINIGVMLQYAIGPFVSYYVLSGMNLAFPIIFMITCFFLPQSPYHLLALGRKKEAEDALTWYRGGGGIDVSSELEVISEAIEASGIHDSNLIDSFKKVFGTRGNRLALLTTCGLMFFQEASGIITVLSYAETILQGGGSGKAVMEASTAAMIIGAVQLISSWFTTMLVDRAGRRPLLILSCGVCSISLFALGTHSYLDAHLRASGLGWLPVTSLIVYITTYTLGLGPLPWVVMGEIFPSEAKSAAGLLSGGLCSLLGFVVTRSFQPISSAVGAYGAYWLYASCSLVGVFFVFFLLPETKCKSLEEIQRKMGVK